MSVLGCVSVLPIEKDSPVNLDSEQEFAESYEKVKKVIRSLTQSLYPLYESTTEDLIETDWIHTQSKVHFVTQKIKGRPKRIYLPSRHRFLIRIEKRGVDVTRIQIQVDQEIRSFDKNGQFKEYTAVDPDLSLVKNLFKKITESLLSFKD